jgi:hypothetical protein
MNKHRPLSLVTVATCTRPSTYNNSSAHFIKYSLQAYSFFIYLFCSLLVYACVVSFVQVTRVQHRFADLVLARIIAKLTFVLLLGTMLLQTSPLRGLTSGKIVEAFLHATRYVCITCPYIECSFTYSLFFNFLIIITRWPWSAILRFSTSPHPTFGK